MVVWNAGVPILIAAGTNKVATILLAGGKNPFLSAAWIGVCLLRWGSGVVGQLVVMGTELMSYLCNPMLVSTVSLTQPKVT